jgi:hypothetical protein
MSSDQSVSVHAAVYTLFEGILDQEVKASYEQGDRVSFIHFEWSGVRWVAFVYNYINEEPQVYRLKVTIDRKFYWNDPLGFGEAWAGLTEKPSFVNLEFSFMPHEALDLMKWYAKVMFYTQEEVKEQGIPHLPYPIKIDHEEMADELLPVRSVRMLPSGGNIMTKEAGATVKKHQGL